MTSIQWTPGIGDPTFMGWLTVAVYFICAAGALSIYLSPQAYFVKQQNKQKLFWGLMCLAMTLLGFNKQLDLQSLMTELGRHMAHQQGWYQFRYAVQRKFIYAVIIAGVLAMLAMLVVFKSIVRSDSLAMAGFSVLIVFVLIRALSFHHMDHFIGTRFLGLKMNWILELGGLGLILLNIMRLRVKKVS